MFQKLETVARKVFYANTPLHIGRLRRLYREALYKVVQPRWICHPENIQIDTQNYCNLWMKGKGCIHCNVKPHKDGWSLPRGWMPTEMIQHIIEYWGKHGAVSVAPYINGEPMMDDRIPWICDISRKNGMYVVVDSNASMYDKRKNIVHPALTEMRFTVSATTPETYEIVHGAPFFREATATVEWFLKNRLPNQYPMLYFITNRYNIKELYPYLKRWMGRTHIVLFPLHEVEGLQTESTKTRPAAQHYWDEITRKVTGRYPWQPYRPIDIYPNGERVTRHFQNFVTCQGTESFSVSWNGLLLHCTDIPYHYNYGHIYDNPDMLSVWRYRNLQKLGHPACNVCNVRHPQHDEILRRYLS